MFWLLTVISLTLASLIPGTSVTVESQRCEEDQSCWDCSTMGNRICGPINGLTWSENFAEVMPGPWY